MNWTPRIGMRVVCVIGEVERPGIIPDVRVYKGEIYTVSAIYPPDQVCLEETGMWGFFASRFRPLEELDLSEELARVEVQRQPLEEREIIREPQRA